MMSQIDRLIYEYKHYVLNEKEVPVDLLAEMDAAGILIDELEI